MEMLKLYDKLNTYRVVLPMRNYRLELTNNQSNETFFVITRRVVLQHKMKYHKTRLINN